MFWEGPAQEVDGENPEGDIRTKAPQLDTDTLEFDRSIRHTTLKTFSWYEVEEPESLHLQAMLAASPLKKGIFFDNEPAQWLPIMLKPDFQARSDPVFVEAKASRFAVPFYDSDGVCLIG